MARKDHEDHIIPKSDLKEPLWTEIGSRGPCLELVCSDPEWHWSWKDSGARVNCPWSWLLQDWSKVDIELYLDVSAACRWRPPCVMLAMWPVSESRWAPYFCTSWHSNPPQVQVEWGRLHGPDASILTDLSGKSYWVCVLRGWSGIWFLPEDILSSQVLWFNNDSSHLYSSK